LLPLSILKFYQTDVDEAYVNGKLDIDIYMEYPEGVKPKPGCDALLLLKKSLYGSKQLGRTWWIELGNKLATLGFHILESAWGLYVKSQPQEDHPVLILVYVDDFVIAARTTTVFQDLLKKLKGYIPEAGGGVLSGGPREESLKLVALLLDDEEVDLSKDLVRFDSLSTGSWGVFRLTGAYYEIQTHTDPIHQLLGPRPPCHQ
jgi:hypothetical protein